jgi:hypothetical protein
MPVQISHDSVIVTSADQISCELADEAAMLQLKSGIYYGLDPVGARIWRLIREPKTIAQVHMFLLSEYEVDTAQCERDLLAFVEALAGQGLIEVTCPDVRPPT